ncbi:hypothetical protein [Actinophytocola glycyrrhizae]|uniref:Uncharacterized protein n=1 Tax=Actinophytocola glycyrrhizae TaxID=2044873 RepID=A0ABV9S4C9_9PSEU
MADEITINLSPDQALVLSHWLDEVMGTREFDSVVNRDRAVWSPLHRISGTLEKTLPEIFAPDYSARLGTARTRLLREVGDVGEPAEDE